MIEAMACGTPVIAFRCGSVPEVIDDGRSGFIVDSEGAALAALGRIGTLKRAEVRRCFEERFSVSRMARDYVAVYSELIDAPYAAGDNVIRFHEPEPQVTPKIA